jgi:hypothetical protein
LESRHNSKAKGSRYVAQVGLELVTLLSWGYSLMTIFTRLVLPRFFSLGLLVNRSNSF